MSKELLGKRFKEIRKSLGYTQEQFAEIAGIEPQSISKIESGKNFPLLSNLEKIANNIGVDLSEFFNYTHKASNQELKALLNEIFDDLSQADKEKAIRVLLAFRV